MKADKPGVLGRFGIALRAEVIRYADKGFGGLFLGTLGFLAYAILLPAVLHTIYPTFREMCPSFFVAFILSTMAVHHTAYIGHCCLLYAISAAKLFERYRVNLAEWPWTAEKALVWGNIKVLVLNFFVIIPIVSACALTLSIMNPNHDITTLPTLYETLTQMLFCILVEDAWNSWFHMTMHSKWLYKNIHKQHHDYKITIGISAEHAHIVEYLFVNIAAVFMGPLILQDRMHLYTMLAWVAYRIGDTVDQHGGYEFPCSPWTILPLSTSAAYHDFHHSHNVGNYGSMFSFWDLVWGSNPYYYEHLQKMAEKKTQ